jgi:hypothetical protein
LSFELYSCGGSEFVFALLTPEKLDLARRLLAEGKGRAVAARMVGSIPRRYGGR